MRHGCSVLAADNLVAGTVAGKAADNLAGGHKLGEALGDIYTHKTD